MRSPICSVFLRRPPLAAALSLALLAAGPISAQAGVVTVTGANGATGAQGKPGGAGAPAVVLTTYRQRR
jgi:hypothetical protein